MLVSPAVRSSSTPMADGEPMEAGPFLAKTSPRWEAGPVWTWQHFRVSYTLIISHAKYNNYRAMNDHVG